jgi:biotin carboxyl carrier protein
VTTYICIYSLHTHTHAVFPGQEICVVEAMKMPNVLRATKQGKVKAILVSPGDTVAADELLMEFESEEEE